MFTIEHIKQAHSKVQSGADFPAYIRDLKVLGVTHYEAYVADGRTDYYGANNYRTSAPARYAPLPIAPAPDNNQFKADLKAHQEGQTDYPTFCNDAARSGVEKWVVDLNAMTCIYYDLSGNQMLVETVPE